MIDIIINISILVCAWRVIDFPKMPISCSMLFRLRCHKSDHRSLSLNDPLIDDVTGRLFLSWIITLSAAETHLYLYIRNCCPPPQHLLGPAVSWWFVAGTSPAGGHLTDFLRWQMAMINSYLIMSKFRGQSTSLLSNDWCCCVDILLTRLSFNRNACNNFIRV